MGKRVDDARRILLDGASGVSSNTNQNTQPATRVSEANSILKKYTPSGFEQVEDDGYKYQKLDLYKPAERSASDYQVDIDRLTSDRKKLRKDYNIAMTDISAKQRSGSASVEEINAARENANAMKSKIADLDKQLDELKTGKWRAENSAKYGNITSNADFAEKSKIIGNSKRRPFGMTIGGEYFGFGDDTYAYINDINNRRESGQQMREGNMDPDAGLTKYSFMSQNEKDIYNYLYQTEGKKSAKEYLDYIEYDLDYRRSQQYVKDTSEYAEKHPILSSAQSVPQNLISGIGLLDVAGQNAARGITGEYKPINYYGNAMNQTNFTTAVRGTVSQDLADEYGTINISEEDHPFWARFLNGKSLGDVYQLGMSMVDSGATAVIGSVTGVGAFGTAMLGGSAGSQGVLTALEKGASDDQALAMGILNGTFEALFEYVSMDKLLNGNTKGIIKTVLKQGFVEGTEELSTTLFNTIADICVMAENSDYRRSIQSYIDQGYSQKEAEVRAMQDIAIGMGWDFIGGAISGGIMGGGKAAINKYILEPYNYKKAYGQDIDALVSESLEISPDNKLAKEIQEKLDDKKKVSGRQIRDLVNQNEADILSQDKASITSAIEQRLTEYGETGYIPSITKAIAKQVFGEKLDSDEMRLIRNSKYGQRVANELNPENIRTGGYNTQWAEQLDTNRINPEEYSRLIQDAENEPENASETTFNYKTSHNTTATENEPQKQEYGVSGTVAKKESVQETENTENAMTIEDASQKYGAQAGAFIHTYQAGQDVVKFDAAYQYAYEYGKSGVPMDTVKELDSISYLSEQQRELAYEAGKAASDTEAKAKHDKVTGKANGKTGRRKGTVKGEGVTISDIKSKFNDQQGRAYRVLSTIAEATGIDIVLYQSEPNADGDFTDAQGEFKHESPDKIYVDLNSGLLKATDVNDLAKYAMLRTFSHEFVHYVEYWNPVQYNEFRKVVFDELTKRGENVNDLIEEKIDTTNLSYEAASREVVAEAMTDILPDSKFTQNLAENHKSIFNKLLEKLKEFVSDIRAYFNTIGANRSREANVLKEQIGDTVKYVESIVDMFDTVAQNAVDNFQKAYAVDEVSSETETTAVEETKIEAEDETKVENVTEPKTTTSEYGFTISDNVEYGSIEISFESKPSEAVRNVLKENKFRWNGKKKVWYGKTSRETITDALNKVYEAEKATAEETELVGDDLIAYNNALEEGKENGIEDENQQIGLSQSEPDGEGTARLLDELQTEDVQGTGGQREPSGTGSERGGQAERDGDRTYSADRTGGSEGSGQSGDLRRDGRGDGGRTGGNDRTGQTKRGDVGSLRPDNGGAERNGENGTEEEGRRGVRNVEEIGGEIENEVNLHDIVIDLTEQKSKETPKGKNFVIDESLNLPSGEKSRFRANIDAIKLIKKLETEGRYATKEEQEVLSKYVGWGGLSNAFGELSYNRETRKHEMVPKSGWEKEFAEFRQLVTDGIITEDEYKAMSASTKNAHYTSIEVIKAMYDGLSQLGFKGGRMLEPSSGVGNFVGGMPASMSKTVNSWTMVELDQITGKIAKYLYPNADVRIHGFETANIPDNYMDVAIGNVPFGNYGVVDRSYPKRITKSIHNYFFAKSLDKVRTGGIVMFITSSFTMNGQDNTLRQYIMDRADLLGAIRLPNTAFSGNAGTEVVTDILVLKKRAKGTEYAGEPFLNSTYRSFDGSGAYINEYFDSHPQMVLGKAMFARGMYGANSLTYSPLTEKGPLGDQIREAFKNITGKMDYNTRPTAEKSNFAVEKANKKTKNNGLEVKGDGKVYRNENGKLVEVSSDKATVDRVSGLLGIRDAYRTLVNYLQQGQDEKFIKKARNDLNKAYDDFVKKYGPINSPKNKAAIAEDPDSYSLLSLENYDAKKKTATKADIFTKNTISANRTITHVDDVSSGVIVSINTTGGLDAALIAKLTGRTEESVTRELIDSRMAFKTRDGSLETPETYLSGNVRAKLREAEALAPIDEDFQNNVEELRKVIPKDIPFNDIYAAVGTPWIPNNVYADFIAEMLGGRNSESSYRGPDVTVGRTNTGDFKIVVNNARLKSQYQNTQKWGTKSRTFLNLMEAMMSNGSLTVNDYIEDENGRKKTVVNKVETAAAQAKAEEISKEFSEWLWKDENRRTELSYLYNETFNALVPPKYNGDNLRVNGLNPEFQLRAHQANAVQRIISSGGNTLLAHRVGAGKTLEMAAAAMKLRELGIVKKPVFVVPKNLVAQWGVEFKSYFPAAKLLVADEKSFTKANRKTFSNRIANGDYDAVILSYEQFEKIPMSAEYKKEFYQNQIDEIMDAIAEEKAESRNGKGITVKEMEKKKAQLEKKIAELTTKAKDDDNIDFEQLGIDSLFVDEAHKFKNLQYVTRMRNVSGLGNTDGSQRAFDLYTKVRYLQGLNGGRGIVFATATPVMNSMSEMYIMQKYLQSDMLEQLGLKTFDAWAKQFGEVVNSVEIKPSGQGFRVKQTFSNFRNLNELQLLFRSFSDVLTDVPGLKIPKMKGGKVQTVVCEPGQFQKDYMAELEKRADNVKNVDPKVDNMLKITSDGRKVSYTQRMIDPTLPYEPGCKIYRCCDNVLAEYKDSSDIKGTQIIFCDLATPKGSKKTTRNDEVDTGDAELDTESAKLYDDMKAYLVKRGIPANEIAFIHDANSDAKKKQLFADVNDGIVRVLIGSTEKMGVGMNAQKRIVAIHHLDAPWRPGDVEQRDGRAFRQKNMNEEVTKYIYVTEGSFDARLWDILDRKQHFINQIMNGDDVGRSAEDTGDVTLSAAEVKALASGNPMIMEQVQLSNDISKLQDLKRAYSSSITAAKAKLLDDEQRIGTLEKSIVECKADIKERVDTYSEGKFSMKIGNKTFTEKKDAGVALASSIISKAKEGEFVTIGKFAGFDLRAVKKDAGEYGGLVSGNHTYKFNVYPENTTYMVNHIIGVVEGLESKLSTWMERLSDLKTDRDAQERMIAEPFSKQEELDQKMARYNEVMAILNPKEEQIIGDDVVQEQQRTSPLTDREVLSIAASEISVDGLNDFEIDALRIFRQRLENLNELEEKRREEGRLYKEQQFGSNVDRVEAEKTLNRMKILDSQIERASNEVIDVEKKEVLKRVLQKSRKIIEKNEREHGKELLNRYRDRQRNAATIKKYKERIKADTDSLTKWILHPKNKDAYHRVPDALKNTIIPFLTSIDFTSKRQLNGGAATKADEEFMKQMKNLRDSIRQNMDINGIYSGYSDLPPGFMDDLQRFIESAEAITKNNQGQFVINRMTSDELKTLSKIVRVVKSLIVQMNSFHQNAMFQHTYDAGDNSIRYMGKMDNAKNTGAVSDFLLWQQIRPAYAFERFGDGGIAIYDEFRRAQATLAFNTKKIIEFTEETYTKEEIDAWEKEEKTFVLGGDTVTIPVSRLMGLYELSKRPQALGHLLGAGMRVATYKNGRNKIADVGHELTPGDISKMINALTPRQKEVADKLQQFMAKQGAEWGNYVSVARFGEEMFGEEHYYPINSDGRHLQSTADEHPSAASLYALLNMSFTKELQEGANNRIILYSIFDVFANHMASMAQYNAFALPILDSLKWFNYQQIEKHEDGSKTVLGSVREQMARVYGTPEETRPGKGRSGYAETFVMNIIKAFNGTETQGIPTDETVMKYLHQYNMAQVAYNFRVVVQQPMAITRAGLLIDYSSIIKGLKLSPKEIRKNVQEMQKYSGIAAWKDLGFYDINISRGLTEMIKHNETKLDKVNEIGMWGAEKADLITWAAIWSACKEQIIKGKSIPVGSKDFYDEVTKLFEDVIYKTQVVDSVLTKNEFLRSKGVGARIIGSFMSEPTTTASMLIDAFEKYVRDMKTGMNRQQAWKKNGKHIVRVAYVYAIGSLLISAVTGVADALRDDDDYQTFLEKWLEAFGGNLADELNPMNKLPIMRDFYELVKSVLGAWGFDTYGNEPRSVIFQWRDYLVKSSEIFHDLITGTETNYTWYGGVYKLLQAVSGITGLPMASATRELTIAWNNTVGAMAPSLKAKTYDPGTKNGIKYAYQDGYLTEEEAIDAVMNGVDEDGKPLAEDENDAYWIVNGFDGDGKYDAIKYAIEADDMDSFDDAMDELTTHGVDEKTVLSKAKSTIKERYTGSEAVRMLAKYTGMTSEDIREFYDSGVIRYNEAVSYLKKYAGKSDDDATATVERWKFIAGSEKYKDITTAAVSNYNEYCASAGISKDMYFNAWSTIKDFTGEDLDGDGKSDPYTKSDKILSYIGSLGISGDQKTSLALAFGISRTTIAKRAPW